LYIFNSLFIKLTYSLYSYKFLSKDLGLKSKLALFNYLKRVSAIYKILEPCPYILNVFTNFDSFYCCHQSSFQHFRALLFPEAFFLGAAFFALGAAFFALGAAFGGALGADFAAALGGAMTLLLRERHDVEEFFCLGLGLRDFFPAFGLGLLDFVLRLGLGLRDFFPALGLGLLDLDFDGHGFLAAFLAGPLLLLLDLFVPRFLLALRLLEAHLLLLWLLDLLRLLVLLLLWLLVLLLLWLLVLLLLRLLGLLLLQLRLDLLLLRLLDFPFAFPDLAFLAGCDRLEHGVLERPLRFRLSCDLFWLTFP